LRQGVWVNKMKRAVVPFAKRRLLRRSNGC
jgi:hypothetical protein